MTDPGMIHLLQVLGILIIILGLLMVYSILQKNNEGTDEKYHIIFVLMFISFLVGGGMGYVWNLDTSRPLEIEGFEIGSWSGVPSGCMKVTLEQVDSVLVRVSWSGLVLLVAIGENHTLVLYTDHGVFSSSTVEQARMGLTYYVPALRDYTFEPFTGGYCQ